MQIQRFHALKGKGGRGKRSREEFQKPGIPPKTSTSFRCHPPALRGWHGASHWHPITERRPPHTRPTPGPEPEWGTRSWIRRPRPAKWLQQSRSSLPPNHRPSVTPMEQLILEEKRSSQWLGPLGAATMRCRPTAGRTTPGPGWSPGLLLCLVSTSTTSVLTVSSVRR